MGYYSEFQKEQEKINGKQHIILEELVLTGKNPALIPLIILGFLTCVFVLFVPILFYMIATSEGFAFGQLLGIVVSIFGARFFLKLFLWNLYGREVIQVTTDRIIVLYDYRYFFSKSTELTGNQFYYQLYESGNMTSELRALLDQFTGQELVLFGLRNETAKVMSHYSIPFIELTRFFDRVNSGTEHTILPESDDTDEV
jgi:hypothetical protein